MSNTKDEWRFEYCPSRINNPFIVEVIRKDGRETVSYDIVVKGTKENPVFDVLQDGLSKTVLQEFIAKYKSGEIKKSE